MEKILLYTDLETSALTPKEGFITEVGMILVSGIDEKEISRYSSYVLPYNNCNFTESAIKATGITKQFLEKNGKSYKLVVKEIIDFLKTKRSKPVFIAHNALFDLRFLINLFVLDNKDFFDYIDNSIGDSLFLSRYLFHDSKDKDAAKKHTLDGLSKRLGIEHNDAHGAIPDIESMIKIFNKLKKKIGSGKMSSLNSDVEEDVDDHYEITNESDGLLKTFKF